MRPNNCWAVLHVLMSAVLVLSIESDSKDSDCSVEIRVRRNTIYETFLGEELVINCTFGFCNSSPPAVTWYRTQDELPVDVSNSSHIKTNWKELNRSEGISYLIFQKIITNDSGLYQCRSKNIISHSINVSVHDNVDPTTAPWTNDTNSTTSIPKPLENPWMYVYTATGIVGFVVIVIVVSVISMKGCKGKSKNETQTDNQYMAVPMFEQPIPHGSLQPSPRLSPSAPLPQRSTQRETLPPHPTERTFPRDNMPDYGKIKKDRERQRNTAEEEGSSIIYAALNHQMLPRAAARPVRLQEEFSEYAAVCVSQGPNSR